MLTAWAPIIDVTEEMATLAERSLSALRRTMCQALFQWLLPLHMLPTFFPPPVIVVSQITPKLNGSLTGLASQFLSIQISS